jgi:hypothetical protein
MALKLGPRRPIRTAGDRVAKVKGTNLIAAVKLLRRNREAALRSLPPELHRYLEGRVLPTDWYPEAHLVALLRAMAPLLRDAGGDPFELMGRAALREHMDGVYEHLLKGGRSTLARRVTALWQTQHDSGRLVMLDQGAGRARWELTEYGHPSREMCGTIRGYILEALVATGYANVRIAKASCVVDGAQKCAWDSSWSEPGAAA